MEQKFKGNFIAVYKECHKEELLKKMYNLVTRHPKKIIMSWEEIKEEFERNRDYFLKIATPGTLENERYIAMGYDGKDLKGFVTDKKIIRKKVLAKIVKDLFYHGKSLEFDEKFNLIDLSISEDGEFRSFKEIVSTDFKKLIALKDKEIETLQTAAILNELSKNQDIKELLEKIDKKEEFQLENPEYYRHIMEKTAIESNFKEDDLIVLFIKEVLAPTGLLIEKGNRFKLESSPSELHDFSDEKLTNERIEALSSKMLKESKFLKNVVVTIFEVEYPQYYAKGK